MAPFKNEDEYKLKAPPPPKTTDKLKILYLCDSMFVGDREEAEAERRHLARDFYFYFGVEPIIALAESVPQVLDRSTHFDILFYDWGGLSSLGSRDTMVSMCKTFIERAKEQPSRLYIMASKFTSWAMEDAQEQFDEVPGNVFLTIKDAIPYLRSSLVEKGIEFKEDLEETGGVGL